MAELTMQEELILENAELRKRLERAQMLHDATCFVKLDDVFRAGYQYGWEHASNGQIYDAGRGLRELRGKE